MSMRRHAVVALITVGSAVAGVTGSVGAEPASLDQVLASIQKDARKDMPVVGLQRANPGAVAPPSDTAPAVAPATTATVPAPTSAVAPAAQPALPPVAAEAPPVFGAPPVIAEARSAMGAGDKPKFQFLPLVPSAGDLTAAPSLWPLLSSQNLGAPHHAITRAVIIIHNADRNADAALARLQKLAGTVASGPEAQTMILAPLFPTEIERPAFKTALGDVARNLAVWSADDWAYGGDSLASAPQRPVSSMLALDVLMLYLADQKSFPNLRTVVLAGTGSGGDMVQRYALYGRAPAILAEQKLALRFVVAGAQSYAYLTDARPQADVGGFATPSDAAQKECASYQDYPYGLESPNAYAQQASADSVRQNFSARDIAYLYGAQDTQSAQDQSCAAKLQGGSVKARAENYERYLQSVFPDARGQRFSKLAGIGGGDKIWGSTCGVSVLFADGDCLKN